MHLRKLEVCMYIYMNTHVYIYIRMHTVAEIKNMRP